MKVVFKLEYEHLERITFLQQSGLLPTSLFKVVARDKKSGTLTFEGSHDDMRRFVPGIKLLFQSDASVVIRPVVYEPDDKRLRWDESLESYLFLRATWEEFKNEAGSVRTCDVPVRFISKHAAFHDSLSGN